MNRDRPLPKFLPLALGLVLLAGILVAWSPRYWPTTVGIAGISVLAATWAVYARKVWFPPQTLLVIPIGAWGFLQLAFRTSAIPALTLRAALVWTMCAVVFFLSSQILRERGHLRLFLNFMLGSMTFLAVAAILQAFTHPVRVFGIFPAEPSVVGTMFYKNHFAALMELGAPIALWRVKEGKAISGGLCFAAIFGAAITSLSRTGSALVGAELVVFLGLMVFSRSLPVKSIVTVVAMLLVFATGSALVVGTDVLWERFQQPDAYHFRGQLARSTLVMVEEHPWIGSGLGTWRAIYPKFAFFDDTLLANEAHNDLAQWASDGGVPFLLLMATLTVWLAWPAARAVWGLGVISLILHCSVDYALRAPSLAFIWFAVAGALTLPGISGENLAE